jgi:hypothetical protein
MQVFAREPVGSAESCNLAPDLAFLALQTFVFGLVRGELLQISSDQRGDGRIALGCGDPGAPVSLVVNCDCDIAHASTVLQYPLHRLEVRNVSGVERPRRNPATGYLPYCGMDKSFSERDSPQLVQ